MKDKRVITNIAVPENIARRAYAVFDPGTLTGGWEDLSVYKVFEHRLLAVATDGVSQAYANVPGWEKKMFDGKSGGEMAVQCMQNATDLYPDGDFSLSNVVMYANSLVRDFQERAGVDVSDPARLSGFTMAAAAVSENEVDIITAGDCIAAWQFKDGRVGSTINQVRRSDIILNAILAQLKQVVLLDRQALEQLPFQDLPERVIKAALDTPLQLKDLPPEFLNKNIPNGPIFKYFFETLCAARRMVWNNPEGVRGYGIVNGDPRLYHLREDHLFKKSSLKTLILCSDGFYTTRAYNSRNPQSIPNFLFSNYNKGGLEAVRDAVDADCLKNAQKSYIAGSDKTNEPEGNAIAIEF